MAPTSPLTKLAKNIPITFAKEPNKGNSICIPGTDNKSFSNNSPRKIAPPATKPAVIILPTCATLMLKGLFLFSLSLRYLTASITDETPCLMRLASFLKVLTIGPKISVTIVPIALDVPVCKILVIFSKNDLIAFFISSKKFLNDLA